MTNTERKRLHGHEVVSRASRRVIRGLAAATLAWFLPASPAFAHHGWPGFDTQHLIYVAGRVSSDA